MIVSEKPAPARRLRVRPTWACFHWALVALILFLFFASYVAVFGSFEAIGNDKRIESFQATEALRNHSTGWHGMILAHNYGVSLTYQLAPVFLPPNYTTNDGRLRGRSVGVMVNGVQYSYADGTVPGIITQTIGFDTGDSQDYPFDEYTASLNVCQSQR
jgi:hypothetical protein